jgi:hypothetical protein
MAPSSLDRDGGSKSNTHDDDDQQHQDVALRESYVDSDQHNNTDVQENVKRHMVAGASKCSFRQWRRTVHNFGKAKL